MKRTIRYEVTAAGRAAVASAPYATPKGPCQWAYHCDVCSHLLMFCICAKPSFPVVLSDARTHRDKE